MRAEGRMAEVGEELEEAAAAVAVAGEEIQERTLLPEMTGGAAALEEVLSAVTAAQGRQEVEEELAVVEKVEMLTLPPGTEGLDRGL